MFEEWTRDGIVTLRPNLERFDTATAPEFKRKIHEIADRGDRIIVLDLSRTEYIDSTALGALVSGFKAVAPDGRLVLCGISVAVETMLSITRMDRILPAFPDEESAREALAGSVR
ncbi:MAG: STAS domain-containing protein [bacterium]